MGELQVINEGVGYPLPFELAGAPGIDAELLAKALNERRLSGVHFRPAYYQPYYGTSKGQRCGGVQIHITDTRAVHLTAIQFHVLDVVRKLYPDMRLFGNKRDRMFDQVCGTDAIRLGFESGRSITGDTGRVEQRPRFIPAQAIEVPDLSRGLAEIAPQKKERRCCHQSRVNLWFY
jgi:uncharacterized protein YbbC (DUF1343 family)